MAEIISVTNAAGLFAALSSAQGGDRIELAGGDYGLLDITGVTFPSDVTIVSADPGDPAIFRDLNVSNASHLVFDGIVFSGGGGEILNSSYINVRNSVFAGNNDANGSGIGFGLRVSISDHIVVENNEIFHWSKAATFSGSSDVVVRSNDVHSVSNDAFNFVSVNGVLVEGNWIHDFQPSPTGHNDMIQFWNVLNAAPSQNITIRGNFFDSGTGNTVQTIFMNSDINTTATFAEEAYRNILIEDNVIYGAQSHGITVGEADGLTIKNNTILADAFTFGIHDIPQINLAGTSRNVLISDNINSRAISWWATVPGWTVGSQFVAQNTDPNGENYYGDLFVNALAEGATLADLRALPGGLIDTLGVGAEMTRADITLESGPAAMVSR